jgi:hypothetical protein
MRFYKLLLTLLLFLLCLSTVSAKPRCRSLYIFGVSASFNDSVVYITNIQLLDSAWVDDKHGFLIYRQEYSNQLKNYFVGKGQLNRTCLVCFSDSEKKILKKYEKMKKRYKGDKKHRSFDYREVDEDEFKFIVQPYTDLDEEEVVMDKKAQKKAEKARKKMEKGGLKSGKDAPGEDITPPMPPRR